ncbi:MAG: hypothetical protein R3189_04315 [Thiomicrorhabdus chilensis]|uniref:hypothetical protein n=1 Tax=Thiomicrorhabdus chilensis TaxID=63656 RepID=UPI0012FDF1A4|nr:hypothetical protein [Thiomicrorhabdus chilensis]MDX1347458.1 hypothetical protein [Thiomicrorhabdus chilensis]
MISPEIKTGEKMSNTNQNKIKAASWFKYSIIGALLLLAPVTLISQMVLPMVNA